MGQGEEREINADIFSPNLDILFLDSKMLGGKYQRWKKNNKLKSHWYAIQHYSCYKKLFYSYQQGKSIDMARNIAEACPSGREYNKACMKRLLLRVF